MPYDDKSDLDPKAKAAAAKPLEDNPLDPAPAVDAPPAPMELEAPKEDPADLAVELRSLLERLEASIGLGV